MKVWVSKHPFCCRTPTKMNGTLMADYKHGVRGPPWVFHSFLWVYDSKMGASTPTLSYNSPPMIGTKKVNRVEAALSGTSQLHSSNQSQCHSHRRRSDFSAGAATM